MTLPPVTLVRQFDTHRLIPSKYSFGRESVLSRIADSDADFAAIVNVESATNDRLLAETDLLPGIGRDELVFGVPYARIVNAAFCHAHPLGSRFNGPDRGAWYASFAVETAHAEVAFHRAADYAEVSRFEDIVTYDDYLADFSAEMHDLRNAPEFAECLAPDSYLASQALAEQLVGDGSLGLVYPSVRHAGGTCVGCFRPALVGNVRKGPTYQFTWAGSLQPVISLLETSS